MARRNKQSESAPHAGPAHQAEPVTQAAAVAPGDRIKKGKAAKATANSMPVEGHAADPLATFDPGPKPRARPVRRARLDVDGPARLSAPTSAVQVGARAERRQTKPAVKSSAVPAPRGAAKAASAATPRPSRLSALDAAAQVLTALPKAEARAGLTAADLIERMSSAKLWTSPGGKTPAATLYAAMTREITTKGDASRFVRPGPGRFAPASIPASAHAKRTQPREVPA